MSELRDEGASPGRAVFPPHVAVAARHAGSGLPGVLFLYAERDGVRLRLPPGASDMRFTDEQLRELRAGMNAMQQARRPTTG